MTAKNEANGGRFSVVVSVVDHGDTNDNGEPYIYRSIERLSESEFRESGVMALRESAAWQQTERLVAEWRERNDE